MVRFARFVPLYRAGAAFARRMVFAPPSAAALAPMCAALLGGCCAGVTAFRVTPKVPLSIITKKGKVKSFGGGICGKSVNKKEEIEQ